MPHAELASAKDSPSKFPEEAEDDGVDAQAAAKRFLPFSTGKSPHKSPLWDTASIPLFKLADLYGVADFVTDCLGV